MSSKIFLSWLILPCSCLALAAPAPPADRDGDGICDQDEEILGTDPARPDVLRPIITAGPQSEAQRKRPGYDATKDVTGVEFCHVGEDRYLWRVTLAAPPRLEDTVLHLYIDADADAATGRKGSAGAASTGTEYMVSVVGGRSGATRYAPDGRSLPGAQVSHTVSGNSVLISADVELGRDEKGARYALYILCHATSKPDQKLAMSDSTRKEPVSGIPLVAAKKPVRPQDLTENSGVLATFGIDLLRRLLVAPENLVVPHDKLQLEDFAVDIQTSNRFSHVSLQRRGGKVWTEAPRAGRYHVGFMMYDDSNDERVGIYIEGRLCGVAVARQDNNRTWLYWLAEPQEFRGGERVELRAVGPSGKHGICNILFLPRPPKPRAIEYRVENMIAATEVGRPGRAILSWTTTWPCPTRFEYGPDAKYGQAIESPEPCLVHRVVLDGLDPESRYRGRALGAARDGSPFAGSEVVFTAKPADPPPTRPESAEVPLAVHNPHAFVAQGWPITAGVPFPQGELGSVEQVRLVGPKGEVPIQVRLTARWPDGSVKWLLATFLADVPAEAQAVYRLQYGRKIKPAPAPGGLSVAKGPDGLAVDTGAVGFRIDPQGNLAGLQVGSEKLLAAPCATTARDAAGDDYAARGRAELSVEESGPLRAVVKTVSHLTGPKNQKLLRIETRVEAFWHSAMLRVLHTLIVEEGNPFVRLKELTYHLPLTAPGPWPTLRQQLDDEFVSINDGREKTAKGRVAGSVGAGDGSYAIAVRDFWQNYPKGFRPGAQGLDVQLCPAFEPGLYDKFPFERQGHHLYYYLLDGVYRLKRGMAKTHELLLCFEPKDQASRSCALFQRPLLATAPAEWYCRSRAFYDVAPRDTARFKLYEEAIDKNLKAYPAACERQHDYGMLNYGDWYPERGANWGNIEYDTQHAFFLEYVRSGNPEAFFLGHATELHNRDVDTVHDAADPHQLGLAYVHQMGHVGEYYKESVPGTLGIPKAGGSVSHAWVEGHFDHYFLTGDRRSYEAGCAVVDYFTRKELGRPYDFLSCRTPGWHLIMLAAAHAATGDPYYLNAARVVVDRVLETQDKEPRPLPDYQAQGRKPYQLGTWSRMLVPGHCLCTPRHRGNAGFMVAVLLSGLKYYHDVTGDERVKQCIILGAHGLLDETYSDRTKGFRYTSCPNMPYRAGSSPLMVEGIARAYLWTKDERFRRVLVEALPEAAGGAGYGKSFSMYYRMAPRVLADLGAAGLTLAEPPAKK